MESFPVSEQVKKLFQSSYRSSTQKQYQQYFKKWSLYCGTREINPFFPSTPIESGLDFLASLQEAGASYSALNSARSMLSSVILLSHSVTFGTHPLVKRLMKGSWNIRPSLPRYVVTWDISIVLNMLKSWDTSSLTLKMLTFKLVMLLALVTGQRVQTLSVLFIDHRFISDDDSCTFFITDLLKTSKPGRHLSVLKFEPYVEENLCVYNTVKEYIKRTADLRIDPKFFISYVKPHKPVSKDTLARWILTTMSMAKIDISKFKPHSTRSASVSKAKLLGIPIKDILKVGGWSSATCFKKHYDKIIENESGTPVHKNFSSILGSC